MPALLFLTHLWSYYKCLHIYKFSSDLLGTCWHGIFITGMVFQNVPVLRCETEVYILIFTNAMKLIPQKSQLKSVLTYILVISSQQDPFVMF